MTTALSPVIASRLEQAAVDNGFDQELPREGEWLRFASTQCPLRVWLGTFGDAVCLATFSQQNVARALGEYGTPIAAPLPNGAPGGRTVSDIPALHRLLRRAFQLSKALPDDYCAHSRSGRPPSQRRRRPSASSFSALAKTFSAKGS